LLTNPSHYFSAVGPYTVTLSVLSSDGCIRDSAKIVTDIYVQADGEFAVIPQNCIGDVTSFTSTSNPLAGNTVAEWHWDLGDGNFSITQNPTHIYFAPGTYTIKHWIVTDKGCNSDTAVHTVTVHPQPIGNYNYTIPSCETRVINFTDASVANAGTLNSWSWNFGDPASGASNTSSIQNPTTPYSTRFEYST
jgi:PKD repeat protein